MCPMLRLSGRLPPGRCKALLLPVLLATVLALGVAGCGRSTPPGADVAYGQYRGASFTYLRWEEGLRIMIWTDLDAASSHGSGSTRDPVYRLEGHAESPDGRQVDWRAETSDGKTAEFAIDDVAYDLSDGTLFIVTTARGATEVTQLERDLSGVQATYESGVAFAESDPALVAFLAGAAE
jgi:hypothetical protein